MSAIMTDAPNNDFDSQTGDDGADEFLKLWQTDAAEPSEPEDEEKDDTETETDEDDTGTEDDDGQPEDEDGSKDEDDGDTDEDEEKDRKVLKDTSVVKIKVDGEEIAVPVEKLKRLYGQEASLTRKSQEVAAQRKTFEENTTKHVAASEALLKRAQDRFKPFADLDWHLAAKNLPEDDYTALKDHAKQAYQDVQFLQNDLDSYMENVRQEKHNNLLEEAKKSYAELTAPDTGIKGFNQATYNEMLEFAISSGVPAEYANNLVSAPLIRILHKAMLYEKGSKVVTKTTDKKPKKIIKGGVNSDTTKSAMAPKGREKAMTRLRNEGSTDAAQDAFLAGWQTD